MGDLLGEDFALAEKDTLYRCLDKLLAHKTDLFSFLKQRWEELFAGQVRRAAVRPDQHLLRVRCRREAGKRQFGYSRDKRGDCVQVVIALIVTPEGLPLAYEVLPGNTSDKTTLSDSSSGSRRIRQGQPHLGDGPRHPHRGGAGRDAGRGDAVYLVGTPARAAQPGWSRTSWPSPGRRCARRCQVKLIEQDGETLRPGPQRAPTRQGAGDAAAAAEEAGQAAA